VLCIVESNREVGNDEVAETPPRRGNGGGRSAAYRRRRLTQPSGEFLDLQAALAGE
jgi:hypothetical protein